MKQARTDELEALVREFEDRAQHGMRRTLKNLGWRLTVWGSYKVKRAVDVAVSGLGRVLLAPLLLAIGLAVRLTSPGPAIFRQVRVGRFGRHFGFFKFRSMYIDAEARKAALLARNESKAGVIFKMRRDPRVTPLGRVLRRLSLDELPQLFNVLLGDMSLVGPRPPLPSEVREYTLEDRKRLNVTPGLTCIWQISGRSELSFAEQVRLDKQYIRTHGLWNDLKILVKTVPAILSGKGAY